MLPSLNRANLLKLGFAFIFFVSSLTIPRPLPAQERYPTVARISSVSGPVTYSRGDDPDHWDDAIENVPLTIGDRIYSPEDGRAELQLPSGNFVRLAPRSYFSTLNLSDDIKQFYLGEGTASFNIRRLRSDEVIEVDTPNVSVTLDEPGIYRITVDEDGNSRISARRGRVTVAASGRQIDVENREIRVFGIDSPRYEFVGLPGSDPFDRWVAEREQRFERNYSDAYRYASDEIIGVEELTDYGRWEQIPEYGYAWTPTNVVAGWAPFRDGRWIWQDPYGWTWISRDRWGWATSHYSRWMPYRSRWYWVPVRPRTRVVYHPACVEFVRVRDHVGWFPLHPRDRFIPWWERRDRRPIQNITYVNRTHVTVVNHNTFISARPIRNHIVRDTVIVREAGSTRVITDSLPIPNRSSLRVVSEPGGRRDHRPSDKVLARAAVVLTAPPPAPATFQEKLPEIQKRQGRPLEPSTVVALASQKDDASKQRVRIRPAAAETSGGDFAPRSPGSGPAPQPVTPARGKQLATRESPVDTKSLGRGERPEKSPAQQQPSPAEPSKGVAKPESQTPEQDRERRRQEKQTPERERQVEQQKQQELDRKQTQQKDQERQVGEQQKQQRDLERRQQNQERKAELQKQQQDQDRRREQQQQKEQAREQQKQQRDLERRQQDQERKAELQKQQQDQDRREQQGRKEQAREQERQDLERRQQTRQKEEERKAQLQQDQERREQQKQQLQERQRRDLQRQQELERRQQQQLQDRQSQQQRQQEQERAQQLRQQQLQERQAREQQRQQELEGRQQQQQREQERNAQQQRQQDQIRREQLRQQQLQERQSQQQQRQQEVERRQQAQHREQEREAQAQQRQQEQARRQQAKQQQLQDRQAREQPRVPGQPQELAR